MKHLYAYKNIAIPANVVTIIVCIEIWRSPSLSTAMVLAWVKIITTALLITYIHLFRDHVVFFFMNLGIGRIKFYLSMFTMDLAIFFILTIILLTR